MEPAPRPDAKVDVEEVLDCQSASEHDPDGASEHDDDIDLVRDFAPEHDNDNDSGLSEAESEKDMVDEGEEGAANETERSSAVDREAEVFNESVRQSDEMLAGKLHTFEVTYSVWDDWLHRGDHLQDMQLYHYVRHVERCAKPPLGADLAKFQSHTGRFFTFEEHYPVGDHYLQVVRKQARMVRIVGPNCQRSDVNEGEDNAQFKAMLFTPLRCSGRGCCASISICYPALALNASKQWRCLPSWKARRAEIELLADRAYAKKKAAMKTAVIHDTCLCKRIAIKTNYDSASEHHVARSMVRSYQVVICKVVHFFFPRSVAIECRRF